MRELGVRLKFTQPSLGSVQRRFNGQTVYCMHRSGDGNVMFLPTWWRAIIRDAAKLVNKHQQDVLNIRWDPLVKTELCRFRRYTGEWRRGKPRFALHEAIPVGGFLEVRCLVPSSISEADFSELLSFAGRYYGISPYKPRRYGTFEVEHVDASKALRD